MYRDVGGDWFLWNVHTHTSWGCHGGSDVVTFLYYGIWPRICRSCLCTKLHVFIFRKTEMVVCRHLVCNTTLYVRVIFSFLNCLHLHKQKSERMCYVIGLVIAVNKPGWLNSLLMNMLYTPIPVAARFKHCVCGCSLAGIAGWTSHGGMGVCLPCNTGTACIQTVASRRLRM
jgi:hypothetical protein